MQFLDRLFDLTGRTVVVTGGAGVIGGMMARGLAHVGARVCVLDINETGARTVADAIGAAGGEAVAETASVLDRAALEAARCRLIDRWGRLDILVNAAGGNTPAATLPPDGVVFHLPLDAFRQVFDLNLFGTVLPTQVFGEEMARRRRGVVVNLSSMTAARAVSRVVGYSAAKAAVENFTRWMAAEMAYRYGEGLRVNAIAPGFFLGEQNRALLVHADGTLTERGRQIVAHTPMGRFGEAEELMGTLIWLCSEASRFVTGVVVPVDGGFSIQSGV